MSPASSLLLILLLTARRPAALPSLAVDPRWPAAGATLAVRTFSRGSLRVVSSDHGALIAAWQDGREIGPNSCNCRNKDDIYAQRIEADGRLGWTRSGLPVCTWDGMWGGADLLAGLAPDEDGGAVVLWSHFDGPFGTYARRISATGALSWGPEGATLYEREAGSSWTGRMAFGPDDAAWFGLDAAPDTRIRIGRGRIEPHGVPCSTPAEAPVEARTQTILLVPTAGRDRALAVFTTRTPPGGAVLWTMEAHGSPPRLALPTLIARTSSEWLWVDAAPDGAGGAYLAWTAKDRADDPVRVRLLRVNASGEPRWRGPVDPGPEPAPGAWAGVAAGEDGALLAWSVTAPGGFLLAVRGYAPDGKSTRPPLLLGAAINPERQPVVAAIPGGWVVAWTELLWGDRESARAALVPDGPGPASDPVRLFGTDFCQVQLQTITPTQGAPVVFASTTGCVTDPNVLRAIRLRP